MIYKDDKVMLLHQPRELVTAKLPDNSVDLVLEDPPYFMRKENWDEKRNYIYRLQEWLLEALRISKSTVIWFMGNNSLPYILQALAGHEDKFHRLLIWDKPEGSQYSGASNNNIWYSIESILIFTKNKELTTSYGKDCPYTTATLSYRTVSYNDHKHPTSKPLGLIKKLLSYYSNENDLVFDGFGGSFTTAVACVETGRRIISCEMNPKPNLPINEDLKSPDYNPDYFNRGIERVKNAVRQYDMFVPKTKTDVIQEKLFEV